MLSELADLLQTPKRLAWKGIHSLLGGEGEAPEFGSQVLGKLGMDEESPLTKALGFGVDVLGDPLTWAAPFAGKAAGYAQKALAGNGRAGLLAARRTFPIIKDIDFANQTGRIVGMPAAERLAESRLAEGLADFGAAKAGAEKAGGDIFGTYYPKANAAYMGTERLPTTLRHETIHGLIRAAAQGAGENLPLPMRAVGSMLGSPNSVVSGLGNVGEELLAHSLAQRGLGNQLATAGKFLMRPDEMYARQFAEQGASPLVVAMYRHFPKAAYGGLAAGTGAAAYPFFSGD